MQFISAPWRPRDVSITVFVHTPTIMLTLVLFPGVVVFAFAQVGGNLVSQSVAISCLCYVCRNWPQAKGSQVWFEGKSNDMHKQSLQKNDNIAQSTSKKGFWPAPKWNLFCSVTVVDSVLLTSCDDSALRCFGRICPHRYGPFATWCDLPAHVAGKTINKQTDFGHWQTPRNISRVFPTLAWPPWQCKAPYQALTDLSRVLTQRTKLSHCVRASPCLVATARPATIPDSEEPWWCVSTGALCVNGAFRRPAPGPGRLPGRNPNCEMKIEKHKQFNLKVNDLTFLFLLPPSVCFLSRSFESFTTAYGWWTNCPTLCVALHAQLVSNNMSLNGNKRMHNHVIESSTLNDTTWLNDVAVFPDFKTVLFSPPSSI